ncbi:hypothetical protein OnM2_090036 [Erysiphe neolycopersici]|uniref:Uncharacterized protein n=1 Tax=Erysiphe neolycopersici TaxID=212602 RepID=A0A420HCW5_9PEZI|nr:hypothetical protein OnM2_090036 [Erysiphe neolycopersici]
MATWGAYFTSFVGKATEEPLKDSSLTGSGSTVEKNQQIFESTASKSPPTSKIAEPKESNPKVEGVKKLYDLNPLPDSNIEQSPPKINSNAARVAKLFGYGSPAAPVASKTPQTASDSAAPVIPKPSSKPIAPKKYENLSTPQKSTIPITPAKPPVEPTPQPTAGLSASVVTTTTPENVKNDVKKPSGLRQWVFGSTAKVNEPNIESNETKSSFLSAKSNDQQTTASRSSVRMLSELQTSLQNVNIFNEKILPSSEANLAQSELNGASTWLASKSNFNTINPSHVNINAPTHNKFDSSHSNASALNSSRPESVASSASASTRYNQSSGLSSPMSRRDSIFSRFSTSSLRPYDNSLASVEEKVTREIRLQAEKENRMRLMAFTKSIEEMRIEKEKMESDRKRMMDEKAAFERDEYQLKDKEEQMRIFIADFEQENEREKLRLDQEEEEKEKRRQQEALRLENEEKIRKQIEEKEQREEQERILLEKEKLAQQEDIRENKRSNSPIPSYNLDTEPQLLKTEDKEELKKMSTNQEDEDDYSIYDDYYDEESDQGEESLGFQKQLETTLQNGDAKQQRIEEEEYEVQLKRQRSLQASRLREEEDERQRYAEEQARRFRQRPIQTGSPTGAPGGTPPQIKLPQMGLQPMGSPQMRSQMAPPQMRPQMSLQQMRPQMSLPQVRPAQTAQRMEQRGLLRPGQRQFGEENFRMQQEIEESEDIETDKEEEMRKAEIKMRKAFAEMSSQKGTGPSPAPAPVFQVQSRPPRNQNPIYITPAGGLPAGPRRGNGGLPPRPR